MENASKALIIAGSILLAMLIIAIGLYIANSSNIDIDGTTNEMNDTVFNQKYIMYEGNQRGSTVKRLLLQAAKDNEELNDGTSKTVHKSIGIRSSSNEILSKSTSSAMTSALKGTRSYGVIVVSNIRLIASWINIKKTYKISFNYGTNGRINEISIDDV